MTRPPPRARALLPGHPELAGALRRAAGALRVAGARGAGRRLGARARVGELQLREGVADLLGVGPERRLDERQQRRRGVYRLADLLEVGLLLGAGEPGLARG